MAKRFVPGSVGVHDAAGIYQQAWDFYAYILDTEKEADRLLAQAVTQLEIAQTSKPGLHHHAEEVEAQAREMAFQVREIQVRTMGVYAQQIGSLLTLVQAARDRIGDDAVTLGLGQFDLDLKRAWERFNGLYAPFYGLDKGTQLLVPNVREWGKLDWAEFHMKIAGPILLWKTISECRDMWAIPGVPPCHGPDYLRAWTLANQSGVMLESHAHALGAITHAVEAFFVSSSSMLADGLTGIADGIVVVAQRATKGIVRGLGRWFPVLIAAGVAAVVYKQRKK